VIRLVDLLKPFTPATRGRHAGALTSADVRALRRPLGDADRVLVSETHLWLRRLPTMSHPKHLCRFYPRVANRIAQCWDVPHRVQALLRELLVDRRGGRAGFPSRIVAEIQLLQRLRDRQSERPFRPGVHTVRLRRARTGAASISAGARKALDEQFGNEESWL
jgi:hypothetical protein